MPVKMSKYKKLGIGTATITTILCSFCFARAIFQEGIRQMPTQGWFMMGTGIFILGAVWFFVIVMPNE